MTSVETTSSVVYFLCLHGSAKSLIAAQHFNRLAHEHGLALHAESMGIEPDASVPAPVVMGLARDGLDVRGYLPQPIQSGRLERAMCVVSFGCEIPQATDEIRRERWDDLPLVSDGFDQARDAIVVRVAELVDKLTAKERHLITARSCEDSGVENRQTSPLHESTKRSAETA